MSVRLAISVEGQTEERFVKDLLMPHLTGFGVLATPVIVATSRSANGQKAKGGGINIDRVKSELGRLIQGFSSGFVTSLYDFYGFRDKLPKERVEDLEARIAAGLRTPRNLIPYVQLHEFEGLLLSDAAVVAEYFQVAEMEAQVVAAVNKAGSAEMVNDGPMTAPSKRLENWTHSRAPVVLRYSKKTKTTHGPKLAARLTLPVIRAACPRFNSWVGRLEHLGQQ